MKHRDRNRQVLAIVSFVICSWFTVSDLIFKRQINFDLLIMVFSVFFVAFTFIKRQYLNNLIKFLDEFSKRNITFFEYIFFAQTLAILMRNIALSVLERILLIIFIFFLFLLSIIRLDWEVANPKKRYQLFIINIMKFFIGTMLYVSLR